MDCAPDIVITPMPRCVLENAEINEQLGGAKRIEQFISTCTLVARSDGSSMEAVRKAAASFCGVPELQAKVMLTAAGLKSVPNANHVRVYVKCGMSSGSRGGGGAADALKVSDSM